MAFIEPTGPSTLKINYKLPKGYTWIKLGHQLKSSDFYPGEEYWMRLGDSGDKCTESNKFIRRKPRIKKTKSSGSH